MTTPWPQVPLGELVADDSPICYGILMPGEHVPNGVPVIKVKNFEGGELRVASLVRTTEKIDQQYQRSRTLPNDILLSIRGTTGEVALVPPELPVSNITQDTARIRTNSRVDRKFLVQALRSEVVQAQIRHRTIGQAVKGINIGCVRKLAIPLPSLAEQKALANVLSAWDHAIRLVNRLLTAKLRFKRGLMQQLLTGKRRFSGFKDGWRHLRIGDIATETSERNDDGDAVPVLSCTKHGGLVDSLEYFGKRVFSENTANYKVVRRNDFAYATNHIEEGSIGLLSQTDAGLVSPMYTVFRTNAEIVPEFLYRLLKTETYRQVFASFTSASVNRRGSLRWKQFATIPLTLPSLEEQRRINETFCVFDREIDLLRQEMDALKKQKKGLMQELLTGQVRVIT